MNKYLNNPQGDIMKNFGNQDNLKNQIQYSKDILKDSHSGNHFLFDVKTIINLLREEVRRNSIIPTMNKYFPQFLEQNASLLFFLYKTLILNLKMQNIVEANNKFEKFLMPIFTKLSVDNRIISNYRMLLNKEITNQNINEIKKRINLYSEHLLDIIAYNLHKSEENSENFLSFVNRRNVIKDFDIRKIEILFSKHSEIIIKNPKNNSSSHDELAELNDLEAQIFDYIRLGNDCENYNKNNNIKKCVAKNQNNNGLICNSNNRKAFVEENSISNLNPLNNNNLTSNYNPVKNISPNNFKHPFENKIKKECSSDSNFKKSPTFYNMVNREKDYNLYKDNYDSYKDFSLSKKENFMMIDENVDEITNNNNNIKEKINISLKKPIENKNIFFEVVQGNNSTVYSGKENNIPIKIEKNSNKEYLKNKKILISNANETLNHFLDENINENFMNQYTNSSALIKEDFTLNTKSYNINYFKDDYYKTACEVESYLNSDSIENSSNSNTNYYSNLNTFVDKTKAGFPLSYSNTAKNENIQDFVMFIENQNKLDFFNPLSDIYIEKKEDLNTNFNFSSENLRSKIARNNTKANRTNFVSNTNNIQNKDLEINSKQALDNVDIFFEKIKDNNNDSTGGDFDREVNSMDDFSHVASEIDNLKKVKNLQKNQNKELEEQILKDPNSNYNYYSRQYIPKANKKSEKFKNMIPFLRDFNPKFLKKENIDKKILRKFRNFVKSFMENDLSSKIYSRIDSKDELQKAITNETEKYNNLMFLRKFYKQNLLPPMNFCDDNNNISIEFKSFNTNYMLWLFSQEGISEIYKLFTDNLGNEILNDFVQSYNLDFVNKKSEIGIIQTLKDYIFSIEKIYTTSKAKSSLKKKPANPPLLAENQTNKPIDTEYYMLNSGFMAKPKNLIPADKNKISSQKRTVLDYEIIYQKNRSNTMTSEDIFDKCIDDLEIKNQSMILDFYNSKKEEKNKNLSKVLTSKDLNEPFKIWSFENNDEMININNGKKLIGKIVNEDQMYFEGFNNQQLENLNYFY